MGLAIMGRNGWKCKSMNVRPVYLQGEEIKIVVSPKPLRGQGHWSLRETVYGLKDVARAW